MKKAVCLLVLFLSFMVTYVAVAKEPVDDKSKKKTVKKHKKKKKKRTRTARIFYVGTGGDCAMFSTAFIHHVYPPNTRQLPTNTLGTVRFTGFPNVGFQFNFNFDDRFGIFTGIDVKNLGFIDFTYADSTVKRRSYNIGIPLGIKIGNMNDKKAYGFFGAGIDKPFNYKQKQYMVRAHKLTRFNEWYSEATPPIMPYLFIGAGINQGAMFKLQYYPGNFLNPNYKDENGRLINYGYNVRILAFSIGYWIPISKRHHYPPGTTYINKAKQPGVK